MRGDAVVTWIDQLLSESPVPLAVAAQIFAEFHGGKPVHVTTLARWIHKGHRLPSGARVKLEALRLGGKFLVSRAAILRFIERQQEPVANTPPTRRLRSGAGAVDVANPEPLVAVQRRNERGRPQ
jgi:hypothetical protein